MTASSNANTSEAPKPEEPSGRGVGRQFWNWRWPLLYVLTLAAVIWWYEFRPAMQARQMLQGSWQRTEGVVPDEKRLDTYFHVRGDETFFTYQSSKGWQASRSRVELEPLRDAYLVRRQFGYDYGGTTRENEYIIYLKDDRLYMIHGLATLSPTLKRDIAKLYRVDTPPKGAIDAIQANDARYVGHTLSADKE